VSNPTPGPLARLAARAAFDELTGTIADVAGRVTPWLTVVEVDRQADKPERKAGPPGAGAGDRRWMAALRVRPDLVLVYVPTGMRVAAIAGLSASPQRATAEEKRAISLVRVTAAPDAVADFANALSDFSGLTYVAVIEGAMGGPAARPAFVARIDAVSDTPWATPLLKIGGDPQFGPGAFVFTLDGRLIGLSVPHAGGIAIVPAVALDRAVTELTAAGSSSPR